jgi:hypothetical protein
MKQLTTFSPAADVLQCLLNALTDACMEFDVIYDDTNDQYIHLSDVNTVIAQLREIDA